MRFEWDPRRERENLRKHGLSFASATRLFTGGADYLEILDGTHSEDEDRFIAVGPVEEELIVVVFTEPDHETIRIISARAATRAEVTLFRRHMEARG